MPYCVNICRRIGMASDLETEMTPAGPPKPQPRDVAAACLFLASPASRYITGQLLAVDGGFLIS